MEKIGILQNKGVLETLSRTTTEICKGIYVKVFPMVAYLFLTSCVTPYRTTEISTRPYSVMGYAIHVVEIEKCEYIMVGGVGITHKQNCKNHNGKSN